MTVKQIISQLEKLFGRIPEKYIIQLINDGLDDISAKKKNYKIAQTTDLEGYKRWYELDDQIIQVNRVEILDSNDRYVVVPKLTDPQNLLREDTDSGNDTLK
mgnify:FL=1|jgi:hypothetical protein